MSNFEFTGSSIYITFSWVDWLRNGESLRSGPIYMENPVDKNSIYSPLGLLVNNTHCKNRVIISRVVISVGAVGAFAPTVF